MKLREIMTQDVYVIPPGLSLGECAMKMKELDVGALPVCHNDRIIGIITDRDLVIKALAGKKDLKSLESLASMTVKDIMSTPVVYSYEDEEVSDVARLLEVKQIRRLIVLNRQKRLVGFASLGDIASKTGNELSGEVLQRVSDRRTA